MCSVFRDDCRLPLVPNYSSADSRDNLDAYRTCFPCNDRSVVLRHYHCTDTDRYDRIGSLSIHFRRNRMAYILPSRIRTDTKRTDRNVFWNSKFVTSFNNARVVAHLPSYARFAIALAGKAFARRIETTNWITITAFTTIARDYVEVTVFDIHCNYVQSRSVCNDSFRIVARKLKLRARFVPYQLDSMNMHHSFRSAKRADHQNDLNEKTLLFI